MEMRPEEEKRPARSGVFVQAEKLSKCRDLNKESTWHVVGMFSNSKRPVGNEVGSWTGFRYY